jgi:hypothetical protein
MGSTTPIRMPASLGTTVLLATQDARRSVGWLELVDAHERLTDASQVAGSFADRGSRDPVSSAALYADECSMWRSVHQRHSRNIVV